MIHRRDLLAVFLAFTLAACGGGGGGTAGVPTDGPSLVYVAIGASDAVGIGAFPSSKGYVPVLAGKLAGMPARVTLQNLGVSGAWADEMLADQLPAANALQPDVVTIWTGTNDLIGGEDPQEFGETLDEILGSLRSQTDAVVLVGNLIAMTQAPRFRDGSDPDVTEARVDAFNLEIEKVVAANACVLVPLFDLEVRDDLFFIDGFHPNNAGHQRLADAFWAAFTRP